MLIRWRNHIFAGVVASLLFFSFTPAFAQFGDIFGFGKNKVQYKSFDWSVIKTEHFDVYYYEEERQAAQDAARAAERSYAYLSEVLDYQFKQKIPVLLYASHNDFQQTNAIQSYLSEGTQGVTESLKGRVILPITGSYGQFLHVLTHELVHAFQFDLLLAKDAGDVVQRFNPPLWFMEGMAEYLSVGMDNITRMWMRDAVLNNTLLSIPEMQYVADIRVYRMGQAIWHYVGERYGKDVVGRIFKTARSSGDLNRAFQAHTGLNLAKLSERWQEDARVRYLPDDILLPKPGDIAKPITDPCRDCTTINIVPAISPDGKNLAYIGSKDFSLNLLLRDLKEAKTDQLIRSGSSQSYETLRYFDTSMNWSPDGTRFSFVSKSGKNDAIYIVDARSKDVIRKLSFKNLTGMAAPSWSPTGERLVFTGIRGGISDLYIVNADGSGLQQLTRDRYAYLHPQWSPDGKRIAFTTDRGPDTDIDNLVFGEYNIAVYDLESGDIELVTETGGNHINPVWAKDSSEILFLSDLSGIPNIYAIDLKSGDLYRITNFITGVAGIITETPAFSLAHATGRLAFSAFWNAGWNIYTLDQYERERIDAHVIRSEAQFTQITDEPGKQDSTTKAMDEQQGDRKRFSGLQILAKLPDPNDKYREYSLPDSAGFRLADYNSKLTPDVVVGSGGFGSNVGFAGQTAVLFTDMLGDKNLLIQAAVFGDLLESTLIATYLNQKHRINWAVSAFQFRDDFGVFTATNSAQFQSQIFRGVGFAASRPFNRFTRVELGTNLYFIEREVLQFNFATGGVRETDLGSAYYGSVGLSLVRDTAFWGLAAPVSGTRARFTVQQNLGDLNYTQVIGDYRKYIPISIPRYSIAYRLSGGAGFGGDERIFGIGGPFTFRGVHFGELSGTRVYYQNLEFRFPLLPFLPLQYDFLTGVAFFDAANAWGINRFGQASSFEFNDTLTSYGLGVRFNLGGLFVLRWDFPIKHEEGAPSVFFSIGVDY